MSAEIYPRKYTFCNICGDKQFPRKTKSEKYYLEHMNNTSCDKVVDESPIHKYAKEILCAYLNKGNSLCIKGSCEKCPSTWSYPIVVKDMKYRTEVTFGSSRLDIAGFNMQGEIVYNLEILYKHTTTNFKDRDRLIWAECSALDILDMNEAGITDIVLEDKRNKCSNCIKYNLSYWNLDKYKTVALELGYIHEDKWTISHIPTVDKKEQNKHWKDLTINGKCLSCHKECDVSWGKPFCFKCYKYISVRSRTTTSKGKEKEEEEQKKEKTTMSKGKEKEATTSTDKKGKKEEKQKEENTNRK